MIQVSCKGVSRAFKKFKVYFKGISRKLDGWYFKRVLRVLQEKLKGVSREIR